MTKPKALQKFTDTYLAQCRQLPPEEILQFLEDFQRLAEHDILKTEARQPTNSQLISIRIPRDVLQAFKTRCFLQGLKYQTEIVRLMRDFLK